MVYYYVYQHDTNFFAEPVGSHTPNQVDQLVSLATKIPTNEVNWYGIKASDKVDAINKFKSLGITLKTRKETKKIRENLSRVLVLKQLNELHLK